MSQLKVIHLDGRDGVVATLEKLLQQAKVGQIDGIAVATQVERECVSTVYHLGQHGNLWVLLGAIAELKHRILTSAGSSE